MEQTLDTRIKTVLFDEAQIEQAAVKTAAWIDKNYKDSVPILLGLLKGCVPFFNKVLLKVHVDCEVEFMYVASFLGKTEAQGDPKVINDLSEPAQGRDFVIIEDIVDSGKTLLQVKKTLLKKGARSVRIVTLLDKKVNRQVDLQADLSGFEIDNLFVVGFGLDYEEKFRNLPFIGILHDWVYGKKVK